jgi:hypothetical protein
MSLAKVTATILALALVLQTGCDFWCHNEDAATTATLQGSAVPPCHGASEGNGQQPRNHDTSKECVHPQAADDNAKLQTKVVKASPLAMFVDFPGVEIRLQGYSVLLSAPYLSAVTLSGPPASILRI